MEKKRYNLYFILQEHRNRTVMKPKQLAKYRKCFLRLCRKKLLTFLLYSNTIET